MRETGGALILARAAASGIRDAARALYFDIVASIGVVPCATGKTFRGALARRGETSRWWYHKSSFKDCESDPAFKLLLAVLTIQAEAEKRGITKLCLVGPPSEVVEVLRSNFTVVAYRVRPTRPMWRIWVRGLGSRLLLVGRLLSQWLALRGFPASPADDFEVVLAGYWDWSVRAEDAVRPFSDRYFKHLPDELRRHGISRVGWFLWLDPEGNPMRERTSLRRMLVPLRNRCEAVILQSFLRPWDIISRVAAIGPLVLYLRIRRQSAFREAFVKKDLDFFPVFSERLLAGFIGSELPFFDLLALATERAGRRYRPHAFVTFLEHFPHSRAQYEGLRRASAGTVTVAVQHASYNFDKTFLYVEPAREFRGTPDSCPVPHPKHVCAMGTMARDVFLACGYEERQVVVTGSPRYHHARLGITNTRRARNDVDGRLNLLIVCAQHLETELDMIEAVCCAAGGLNRIRLSVRSHPFSRIERHPSFIRYRSRLTVLDGSLEENLAIADLILYTYSTVAEEALLLGKPVWQWTPLGFNGSALVDAVQVPSFSSVHELRRALEDFQANPDRFTTDDQLKQAVLERLFYRGDGEAASRVAKMVVEGMGARRLMTGDRELLQGGVAGARVV